MELDAATGPGTPGDLGAGWTTIPDLLSEGEVAQVNAACARLLTVPEHERRRRDKPFGGTRHLAELDDRSELIADILRRPRLLEVVGTILGTTVHPDEVGYRSPQPSFGGQKLHADGLPRLADEPASVATAIIALTGFTADNGATRLVPGSHRRPDLQRHSGTLESHPDEIVVTCPAGTAIVFDGHVLHSGTTNRSATERPALHLVWRA